MMKKVFELLAIVIGYFSVFVLAALIIGLFVTAFGGFFYMLGGL